MQVDLRETVAARVVSAFKGGRPDGPPYWRDTVTETRLDHPPWKLKPDGSG